MESLKPLDKISESDPRQNAFSVLDPETPGVFRKRNLEDFHRAAESIKLSNEVPEEIRDHFETARHLIVYSWFYYPFNVTAQLLAFTTVEMALKMRSGESKTAFANLLKKAVDKGWIKDTGFSLPMRQKQRTQEFNKGLPDELQLPEPTMVREYCDRLIEYIPFIRNELAHGSTLLDGNGAKLVNICAELINQLFPPPAAT